jgi:hypothetical protein
LLGLLSKPRHREQPAIAAISLNNAEPRQAHDASAERENTDRFRHRRSGFELVKLVPFHGEAGAALFGEAQAAATHGAVLPVDVKTTARTENVLPPGDC